MEDCGCDIKHTFGEHHEEDKITFCPLHQAAPAMKNALEHAQHVIGNHDHCSIIDNALSQTRGGGE